MTYEGNCKFLDYGIIQCQRRKRPFTADDRAIRQHPSSAFLVIPGKGRVGSVPWKLGRTKSVELRAGVFYKGCECTKNNGLQDTCERRGCLDNPNCTSLGHPTCLPSNIMSEPPQYCKHIDKQMDTVNTCAKHDKGKWANQMWCFTSSGASESHVSPKIRITIERIA